MADPTALQEALQCAAALVELQADTRFKLDTADTHILTLAAEVRRLQGVDRLYQHLYMQTWSVKPARFYPETAVWSVEFVSPYGMGQSADGTVCEDDLSRAISAALAATQPPGAPTP